MAVGTVYSVESTLPTTISDRREGAESSGGLVHMQRSYVPTGSEGATDIIHIARFGPGVRLVPDLCSIVFSMDMTSIQFDLGSYRQDNLAVIDVDKYADAMTVTTPGRFPFWNSGASPTWGASQDENDWTETVPWWLSMTIAAQTGVGAGETIFFKLVYKTAGV